MPEPNDVKRVLVAGVPRSGTTWICRVLGGTHAATLVNEPDNHLTIPFALRSKRRLGLGFHPALAVEQDAPEYDLLWRHAFGLAAIGYRPTERLLRSVGSRLLASASQPQKWAALEREAPVSPRLRAAMRLAVPERPQHRQSAVVVKSVYASLSLDWISRRYPIDVVIVLRQPLSVLSSWAAMSWLGRPGNDMLDTLGLTLQRRLAARWDVEAPDNRSSVVARSTWMICTLTCELLDAAHRHRNWHVVKHEELCEQPHDRFRRLSEACAIAWTPAADALLDAMNRPGSGYDPFRVASALSDPWRSRLSAHQIDDAMSVLERFPLEPAFSATTR